MRESAASQRWDCLAFQSYSPNAEYIYFILELGLDYVCCFLSPDIATAAQDALLPAHTSTSRTAFVVSDVLQLPYHALRTIHTAPPDQEKEPQI
jgi:hypothetical protein